MRRDPVDFFEVRAIHAEIHERLLNWARWCAVGSHSVRILPMFAHYRHGYEEPTVGSTVDTLDGHRMEKLVTSLPLTHCTVLQWVYVKPWIPPLAVRRALGLRHNELFETMHAARSMVANKDRQRA